ncbi:MAG: HAD family hydrolase [Myxococcales bacterium]|nr:HAD family hydrolase [Myxococcales bacterium]
MPPDSLIFDLDGTLWDTSASCAVAWNRVVRRHAIVFREIVADDVRRVTGRPHDQCIHAVFAGLPAQTRELLAHETMQEDNLVIAEQGGDLYEGVVDGLRALSARLPLMIVSNCQRGYIETFLEVADVAACISDFECWGNTGQTKTQNLAAVIARNKLSAPLFVGDTAGDQEAAQNNQVPFAFARYGFGQVQSPEHVLGAFADIFRLVE